MANRMTVNTRGSLEKKVVSIFARFTVGASGAPTLDAANSKGVVSVTRVSAGKYTFVFGSKPGMLDTYVKLLSVGHTFDTSAVGAAPAAPQLYLTNDQVKVAGACSVTLQLANGGAATDPASGEIIKLAFALGDSTAP